MTRQSVVEFRTHTEDDREGIINFLFSIRDELYFSERSVAEHIVSQLFTQGGAIVGEVDGEIAALSGYFLGEPSHHFANKEVGFVYVAGIARPYRGTAAFRTGLRFTVETFQSWGLREIRLHALAQDIRLNSLYSSFAQPIRKEENGRGLPCVLYGNTLGAVMRILTEREKRRHAYNITPVHRPVASRPHGV